MIDNSLQEIKQNEGEGQELLPFLPDWFCYLCRQNKVEKPIVKGYFGDKREIQADKMLNLHLTCTLLIPELHLYFTCQDGFEVFNISKVQTEDYLCLICQDSGNSKKGYSIRCREDTCNNKIHLACINKARIYKLENEQQHLKCFYMCRIHARSHPQPYETTYDKLYNEIQNEWILVYKQLEEQEKQRQLEEKTLQQQNIKGKNTNNKRKNQNSNQNIIINNDELKLNEQINTQRNNYRKNSQKEKQNKQTEPNLGINQQSETSGVGINSGATSTAVDIYQESHSQIHQNTELHQDQLNDKKRRGRPPKMKEISQFSYGIQQTKQKQQQKSQEAISNSQEKNELFDSTCKKVFIESSSSAIVCSRDNQLCSSLDSNVGCSSKNCAMIQLNKQESEFNINKKVNIEVNGNKNLNEESLLSTPYMQLFGRKESKVKQSIDGGIATESTASPQEQNSIEPTQLKQSTDFILNNPLPLQQRRSSRQEMNLLNKKNEKLSNSFYRKNGFQKRSNSLNSSIINNRLIHKSINNNNIYDSQTNKEQDENLIKTENQKLNRKSEVQQVNTKEEKNVINLEEYEQYLECGYPNFNDDKRYQNMENWWSKIDSDYFIKPPNVTSFTIELLEKLKIKQDYEQITNALNQQVKQESSINNNYLEQNNSHIIFYPKQMSFEEINKFCITSIADLYLNKHQQLTDDDSFGYQMNKEQEEESEELEEQDFFSCKVEDKELSNECEIKISPFDSCFTITKQNSTSQTPKRGNQRIQRKSSIKNDSIQSFKDGRKSLKNKEKLDQKKQTNFDHLFLQKNLRDFNNCRENLELNMLIVDCDDSLQEQDEKIEENIKLEYEEKIEQNNGLIKENIVTNEYNQEQSNILYKVPQQDGNDIKLENGVQNNEIHTYEKDQNQTDSQTQKDQQLTEKKEEDEIKQEILENKQELNDELYKIKIEQNEENINIVNQIKDEVEQNINLIQNEEIDVHTLQPFSRPKSQSIKQPKLYKKKYIHYYSSEYVNEPPPLKLNKKFSVLFHSITGDGYLMIYDVNENSDIKRSMTAKNKSEYSICGSFQDTSKLNAFIKSYKEIQAPKIDENRRRAIPSSDTTPQLMFSKLIHLNKDALQMSVEEQIEINSKFNNLLSTKGRGRSGLIDQMSLRTIFFEKQWSINQKRFYDWQNNVQKQIEDEKNILSLKKQSIFIWDQLKQSMTKNNLLSGYANKKEYNTEIYFLMSSDDESDKERHNNKNSNKQNIPNKMPTSLPSNNKLTSKQSESEQNDANTSNKTTIQKKQSQNTKEKFYSESENNQNIEDDNQKKEQQINIDQKIQQSNEQDDKQIGFEIITNINSLNEQSNNSLQVQTQIEDNTQQIKNYIKQQNKYQSDKKIIQSKSKINHFQQSNRKQYLIDDEDQQKQDNPEIVRKNSFTRQNIQQTSRRNSLSNRQQTKQAQKNDLNEEDKEQQEVQNQESDQNQKQKLRVRKPSNSILTQQQTKLTPYMKAKLKALNANSNGITQQTPKNTPITISTIFDKLRKIKINPIVKKIKKNSHIKQKEQLETDCMICFSQKNTYNNPVVYCSDCQQSFHIACYGIVDLPEGKYFCDKCQMIKSLRQKERHQREILQQRFSCPLCVETDLPIKLMYQRQANNECNRNEEDENKYNLYSYWYNFQNMQEFRNNIDKSISFEQIEQKLNNNGELWIHPFCMFTFNLAKYKNGQIILMKTDFPSPSHSLYSHQNNEQIPLDSSISSEDIFTLIKCQICQKNQGITIKCSEQECEEYFHPLCSFFQGFQCKLEEKQLEIKNKCEQFNHLNCTQNDNCNSQNNDNIVMNFEEKIELEFKIRCKKHIQMERTIIQQDEQHLYNELEENISPIALCLVKQTQENLKQDIDFYLKQIFYRRFNVNYEKICSYFYYFEDFQQQIYSLQNVKIKLYNSFLQEYQTLPEALSFIKFGSQTKSKTYFDELNLDQNSNNEGNSKSLVKFDDFDYDNESDFDYSANNKLEEKVQEYEEEEQDEEKIQKEKEIEDQDEENHENCRVNQKNESILQPALSYRKPQKFQRQQQKIQKTEDEFNINQLRSNSSNFYQIDQFDSMNKEEIEEEDELNQENDELNQENDELIQEGDSHTTNRYNQNDNIQTTFITSQNSFSVENQKIQEENDLINDHKQDEDDSDNHDFDNNNQQFDNSSYNQSNDQPHDIDIMYDESYENQFQN